jgi:hypothetical protein
MIICVVRLKMLLWRVALNLPPTKAFMSRFAPDLDTTCPLCGEHPESTIHLLWQCSLARALWFNSSWRIRTDSFLLNSPKHLIEALITPPPPPLRLELDKFQADKFLLTGALIIDQVRKLQNSVVHERSWMKMEVMMSSLRCREIEHRLSKV